MIKCYSKFMETPIIFYNCVRKRNINKTRIKNTHNFLYTVLHSTFYTHKKYRVSENSKWLIYFLSIFFFLRKYNRLIRRHK